MCYNHSSNTVKAAAALVSEREFIERSHPTRRIGLTGKE